MYSTCLFCARALGANDAIEAFPVGRRLAFDPEKGRLWVVCPHCERWNLTPLEERWEAIEQGERLYRGTRLRVATEQIGLARAADGTELVRIGRPERPEMAAWRYGDQFGRRRRRARTRGVVALGTAGVVLAMLPFNPVAAGTIAGLIGAGAYGGALAFAAGVRHVFFRPRLIADGRGEHLVVTNNELPFVRLTPADEGWALRVPYQARRATSAPGWRALVNTYPQGEATLTGTSALEAARRLLPLVNGWGAKDREVSDAVRAIEEWGGPERAFIEAAGRVRQWGSQQSFGDTGSLQHLPTPVRLALEMAAHEERERRALESELAELEQAWRDAEEIAAIADDLLLPGGVRGSLEAMRRRVREVSGEGHERK